MTEARIDDLLDGLVPPFEPRPDGWDDVLARAGRTRRRYVLVAAAAVALLVVPTAVALRGEITSVFEGTPPPPAVSSTFESNNRINADLPIQRGFRDKFPQADVSRAHGVLEVQTVYGPQDLWAAPNDQGGTCWFVDFANDEPAGQSGAQPGSGTCDTGEHSASERRASIATSLGWELAHPAVSTLFGRVDTQADRVVVRLKDGSSRTLPVVEGAFLASLDKDARLHHITAYDGDEQVATWSAPD